MSKIMLHNFQPFLLSPDQSSSTRIHGWREFGPVASASGASTRPLWLLSSASTAKINPDLCHPGSTQKQWSSTLTLTSDDQDQFVPDLIDPLNGYLACLFDHSFVVHFFTYKSSANIKRPSRRDRDTRVRTPTPILMKFAPEVGFGPKPTPNKKILDFDPKNGVIFGSEGSENP